MELKLNINNVKREVHVEPVETGFIVRVDGEEYAVTDAVTGGGRISFVIGPKLHTGLISCSHDGIGFSMRSHFYRVVEEASDADRPTTTHISHGRLEAPMPGNIVAINVDAGDEVTAGQPVIVLESMKMQNEITSPFNGTVERIICTVGEQVGFDQVLAEIAPSKTP